MRHGQDSLFTGQRGKQGEMKINWKEAKLTSSSLIGSCKLPVEIILAAVCDLLPCYFSIGKIRLKP